jgi:hypothetical protein
MKNGGGLDSTLLLNSALKFVMLYWQIAVFSRRIATEKIAVPRIATVRGPNLRAECQKPEQPTGFIIRIRPESGVWQSAVRYILELIVFLIVANRGIGARKLTIQ